MDTKRITARLPETFGATCYWLSDEQPTPILPRTLLRRPKIEGNQPMNLDEFRATRKASGLTQGELAERMGVTLRAVQHWEGGAKPISSTCHA